MNLKLIIEIILLCTAVFADKISENVTEITDSASDRKVYNISHYNVTENQTNSDNDSNFSKLETERIVKPMTLQVQVQTQKINNIANSTRNKPTDVFKPSPQLEIQYEYNKFPVVPAFPEAKNVPSGNEQYFGNPPWFQKDSKSNEPPWISRIRFPTQDSVGQNHPYPFYYGNTDLKQEITASINESPKNVSNKS